MDQVLPESAPHVAPLLPEPNLFELRGRGAVSIHYAASSITGQPLFHYQDHRREFARHGEEIRRVETEIGTLVTITLEMSVDTGSTEITLLVPRIKLTSSHEAQLATVAVVTVNRTSFLPNSSGQLQKYSVIKLDGTARLVFF